MIWVYCRLLRSFACSATNVPNWYWGWKKETRKLWSRFHKNNECKEQEYVRGYDYRGAGGREGFSWWFTVQVSTNRMKSSIWLEIFRDLLPPSTSGACYPEINWRLCTFFSYLREEIERATVLFAISFNHSPFYSILGGEKKNLPKHRFSLFSPYLHLPSSSVSSSVSSLPFLLLFEFDLTTLREGTSVRRR